MRHPGKVWPEEAELVQLVRAAQGGGPGALDALLARLRPALVVYFAPVMGRDEAEDAAQLALLSILRTLPRIDAARALAYVLAVASHRLGNARRQRARAARRSLPLEFAEDVEWPVAGVHYNWADPYLIVPVTWGYSFAIAQSGPPTGTVRVRAADKHGLWSGWTTVTY
jgi:hypothetical protein